MAADPQPEWPPSIDPLVETKALEDALACRADALVIAYAKADNDGVLRTYTFHSGDHLRALGLAVTLLFEINQHLYPREDHDT